MDPKTVSQFAEIPDIELISRVLAGEKKLFELIMRRYNQSLYRIGMSVLGNDAETEEAMQMTYIKAYEHLQQFEQRSAFSTWLIRILLNECLAMKKKKQRMIIDQIEKQLENTGNMKTPDAILQNKQLAQALEEALAQLPEKYRLVFVLREMEDLSVKETGEALGLEPTNVKVRLNRAKIMLRDHLSGFLKEHVYELHLKRCDCIVNNVMQALNIQ